MALNKQQQTLLQIIWSQQILTEADLKQHLQQITGDEDQNLVEYVGVINKSLSFISFEIRPVKSEENGETFYGIINTKNDDVAKLATLLQPIQIQYFKAVLDAIIQSGDGKIKKNDAITTRTELKQNFKATQAEELLAKLVKDRWLFESEDGSEISIDVRTFLELRPYFESTFGTQIPDCMMCEEIITKNVCVNNSISV